MDLPEATARWLGGRILAALDLPPTDGPTKVADEDGWRGRRLTL